MNQAVSGPVVPESSGERGGDSVNYAYRLLREEILTGHLPAGSRLSQVQLAARLEISRTPLREALRRLVADGLVNGDFNQRMRVSELNLTDFDQICAMRFALEPIGLRATLPDLSETAAAELGHRVEAMETAINGGDMDAFRVGHRSFHLGLTVGCGERMGGVLAELWDHAERYRIRYLHQDGDDPDGTTITRLRLAQREHRTILAAAAARDVENCTRELLDHLQRTLDAVFREAAPRPVPRLAGIALTAERVDRR